MNTLGAIAHQFRFDLLRLLRNRLTVVLNLVVPVVFLVVFAAVFGTNQVGVNGRVIATSVYYVPAIITFAVVTLAFTNLTVSVARDRESGIYKRRRATPARPVALVGGRALVAVVAGLAVAALLAGLGRVAYHATLGSSGLAVLALTVIVGAGAFACLAYAVASLARDADSAQLVATLATLPLFFVSGVFIPGPRLPAGLSAAAEVFPVQHLAQAFLTVYTGQSLAWGDLAIVAGWGVGGLIVAARRFSWLPRT
jgi:ABC-2 type transport system permease protein